MTNPEDRWLSVEEICQHLGASSDTIYKWIKQRGLPAHRVGRLWKFSRNEVDVWVRSGGAAQSEKTVDRRKSKG